MRQLCETKIVSWSFVGQQVLRFIKDQHDPIFMAFWLKDILDSCRLPIGSTRKYCTTSTSSASATASHLNADEKTQPIFAHAFSRKQSSFRFVQTAERK